MKDVKGVAGTRSDGQRDGRDDGRMHTRPDEGFSIAPPPLPPPPPTSDDNKGVKSQVIHPSSD